VTDPQPRFDLERRVLVLGPTERDAKLACSVLERAGVECLVCSDLESLCRNAEAGTGAVLLPEEAIDREGESCLTALLARQPPWSDLPVLVLARSGADSAGVAQAMNSLGNVTVLERPMRVAALVSAVRTALRARERQLQIREHLAERERSEQVLREADRRKDEFLAILAHELRNPLAPIRNSVHILRATSRSEPVVEHVGEVIERQVNQMVRLVDDLLEVSRITRGTIDLRREEVDLAGTLASAVETSMPLIEQGGQRLAVALPAEPLTVAGDSVRLTQVFANLLNNAAKYTAAGGEIELRAERAGDSIEVAVRDTGRGIPAEMLPRVFEMFAQVDRSPDRVRGGLGIGLTLVKRLVEMHGGSVEARSEGLGKGSEFVVRLPLAAAGSQSAAGAAAKRTRSAVLAARRILVVDDNRDAASSLGMLLELRGAEVLVVHDGPAALKALATHQPSVVLLDIGMPGMDGYEVARRIRQQPEHRDVTLIALTGWGQEEDRQRSRAAGFDYHLTKPADVAALESLLRAAERAPRNQRAP
jgi:signal transduction histidine kinase/ActR/RegA family two-component response regulator